MCCLVQALWFTDLEKSEEQLLWGSDSSLLEIDGWGQCKHREQREPWLSPSSSQGTTVEQEEGKEKLLAINQQQSEKGKNMTIRPAAHCPLMGESKCQPNSALRGFGNLWIAFLP